MKATPCPYAARITILLAPSSKSIGHPCPTVHGHYLRGGSTPLLSFFLLFFPSFSFPIHLDSTHTDQEFLVALVLKGSITDSRATPKTRDVASDFAYRCDNCSKQRVFFFFFSSFFFFVSSPWRVFLGIEGVVVLGIFQFERSLLLRISFR